MRAPSARAIGGVRNGQFLVPRERESRAAGENSPVWGRSAAADNELLSGAVTSRDSDDEVRPLPLFPLPSTRPCYRIDRFVEAARC